MKEIGKEIKVYRIAGIDWYQGALLYPEFGKALELLEEFEEYFKGEAPTFGSVAKRIYDTGLAPRLFALILKPYCPNWKGRVKSWLYRLIKGIRPEKLTQTLSLPEIFGIIGDFFFINTEWIEKLTSSQSESDMKVLTMVRGILGLAVLPSMSSSSSSPKETSDDTPPQSASSEPGAQQP